MERTRRDLLRACGAAALAGGVAGCLDTFSFGDADGYAAFFPLHDWAEAVSGEVRTFENAVGAGRMGHGFRPDGDLTPRIAATDIFVYLDTPEFSWAQDIAESLRQDHEGDVVLVDALAGLESQLLPFDDEGDGHDGHDHGEETGQDHGEFFDPHVWTDPVLAGEMVGTIRAGLSELDPANEATYRENAVAYQERLDAVNETLTETISTAPLDVAIFAGHDSFGYLEARYDFDLRTPTGVTPDADVSFSDIEDLVEVADTHGIDTVLYDPFEAPQPGNSVPPMVTTLQDAAETVENAEPLSPLEGRTEEWVANDWGWVEQMTEVNAPALERALSPA